MSEVLARTLVDEWARAGASDAVLAPGSRSTPMALALAADPRIRLSVLLDERSAGFFALGTAKLSGRPAIVLTTSGTAAANLHPAVAEAYHARVPLIACTADRPPELRDTGAGQTIDQVKLFGGAVRWQAEVGEPADPEVAGRYWRSMAARAWAQATGPPGGPVHLNIGLREPLVPPAGSRAGPADGKPGDTPWSQAAGHRPFPPDGDVAVLARAARHFERGLVVAGWGSEVPPSLLEAFTHAAGWPVLADGISGLRTGTLAVSTYDALLRSPGFPDRCRPQHVLHLGGPLTGRSAGAWLDRWGAPRTTIDPDQAWLDPSHAGGLRLTGSPGGLLAAVTNQLDPRGTPRRSDWLDHWVAAEAVARRAIDELLDSWDEPTEPRVARDLVAALPDRAVLVVGSSMPVRDVESFAAPRVGLCVLANRGVNGIDGFVSTVLGVAATATAHGDPTVGLMGDLTFLHDAGGLLWADRRGLDSTLVVVDNGGGGIFSFLPQSGLPPDQFERLFGTPHGLDLLEVAAAYGVPGTRVTTAAEVVPAVLDAVAAGGVRAVIVPTDRSANVARHRQAWAAVAGALAAAGLSSGP